jgi:two-component system, NarL family, nitrate/nitrite response regulator NarL
VKATHNSFVGWRRSRSIRKQNSVLWGFAPKMQIDRSERLGALGYIPKTANHHTSLGAVRLVMNGDVYVPPLILDDTDTTRLTHFRARESTAKPVLTDRQVTVLRLVSEGSSNRDIAFELDLSEKTVKAHITAIFKV